MTNIIKCKICEFWYERNQKENVIRTLNLGVCTKNGGEWYEHESCSRYYPKDITLIKNTNEKYDL